MKMFDSIAKDIIRQKAKEIEAKEAEAKEAEAKEAEAEEADPESQVFRTKPMKEYTVEPVISPRKETRGRKPLPRIICPFCDEERKQNGISTHVRERHGAPGVCISDLVDVQEGVKSLEDLVCEKFDEGAEINLRNLSDRCSKEEFGSWADVEENPEANEDPEDLGNPEDLENPEKEAEKEGAEERLPAVKSPTESSRRGTSILGLFILGATIAIPILSQTEKGKKFVGELNKLVESWKAKASEQSPGSKASEQSPGSSHFMKYRGSVGPGKGF